MIHSLISSINPFASLPKEIPEIKKSKEDLHVEVGSSNVFVNGLRNFLSLPTKLMFWNSSMLSGNVSTDTIEKMKDYLHESVNQYKPQEVWRRIFSNPKTSYMIHSLISSINPLASLPKEIPEIKKSKEDLHVEVGSSNVFVNGLRNFLNLPTKLMFWNSSMLSGNVSTDTIEKMKDYLHENELYDVHVSVNQYKPQEVWRRIFSNPKTSLFSKMTLGVGNGLMETFALPKLTGFPGDRYNFYSNTVYLFSNDTAIALHECGHAKDYNNRKNPTLYGLLRLVPFSVGTLYQEYIASSNSINYLREKKSTVLLSHSYKVLLPAYATYCALAVLTDPSAQAMALINTCITDPLIKCKYASDSLNDSCNTYLLGLGAFLLIGHLAGQILAVNAQKSSNDEDYPGV